MIGSIIVLFFIPCLLVIVLIHTKFHCHEAYSFWVIVAQTFAVGEKLQNWANLPI